MRAKSLGLLAVAALCGLAGCHAREWVAPLTPWDVPVADPPAALPGPVRSFFQEPTGVFWFGTDSGAVRFDPASEAFTHLSVRDGLAAGRVYGFQPDLAGGVWIGREALAQRFEPGTGRLGPPQPADKTFFGEPDETWVPWMGAAVRALAARQSGDRRWWGVDASGRLFSLDPETRKHEELSFADPVLSLCPEPPGRILWLGTARGLLRFDVASGKKHAPTRRLARGEVSAVSRDADGALWLWTEGRLVRFVPATGAIQWFAPPQPPIEQVHALARARRGGPVWLATSDGVARFDPATGELSRPPRRPRQPPVPSLELQEVPGIEPARPLPRSFSTAQIGGASGDSILRVHEQPGGWGILWIETIRGAVLRFDPGPGSVTRVLGRLDALAFDSRGDAWLAGTVRARQEEQEWERDHFVVLRVNLRDETVATHRSVGDLPRVTAILPEPPEKDGGAVWLGGPLGFQRLVTSEAGRYGAIGTPLPSRLALAGRTLVRSRGFSLTTAELAGSRPAAMAAVPFGLPVGDVAPGPAGRVWVALRSGGLRLWGPRGEGASLDRARGLPAMDVRALSTVPGSGGRTVWAATADGAARIAATPLGLRVERTATLVEGQPSGPVDVLAALPDGSAFLAWGSQVFHVPSRGRPNRRIVPSAGEIRGLAVSADGDTLWAGTSEGLYVARRARRPGARFAAVRPLDGRAVTSLAIDKRGTVWIGTSSGGAPAVIGYRPGTGSWSERTAGLPADGAVDDLDITPDGELVVLVGSRLAKGKVAVPPIPLPRGARPLWLLWPPAFLLSLALIFLLLRRLSAWRRARIGVARKRRWLRRVAIAAAVVILLLSIISLAGLAFHGAGRLRFARAESELAALLGRDLPAVHRERPRLPAGENAAAWHLAGALTLSWSREEHFRMREVASLPSDEWTPGQVELARLLTERNSTALENLHAAADRPRSAYGITYRHRYEETPSGLGQLGDAADLLSLEARLELMGLSYQDEGLDTAWALTRLVASLHAERMPEASQTAVRCEKPLIRLLLDAVRQEEDPERLGMLATRLPQWEPPAEAQEVIAFRAAMAADTARHGFPIRGDGSFFPPWPVRFLFGPHVGAATLMVDHQVMEQIHVPYGRVQARLAALPEPGPNLIDLAYDQQWPAVIGKEGMPASRQLRGLFATFLARNGRAPQADSTRYGRSQLDVIHRFQAIASQRQLVRAALELRKIGLARGSYPRQRPDLPDLVTPDPFAGRLLLYEIRSDGALRLEVPGASKLAVQLILGRHLLQRQGDSQLEEVVRRVTRREVFGVTLPPPLPPSGQPAILPPSR